MGAATLAQGYITTCITSSPPRPHATSRCIFRNAALVNTRFSMRTAVVGSPSSAMASTDLRSGAHGASATSGSSRHARSSRFARRRTTPSGAPARSQSLGPAEDARAATQPRHATRGPRDAPSASLGRDADAPVAARSTADDMSGESLGHVACHAREALPYPEGFFTVKKNGGRLARKIAPEGSARGWSVFARRTVTAGPR